MQKNVINTGSLETLELGQTLLVSARKVANGHIQLELAELKEGSRGVSAAFVFNKSDDRFVGSAPRRAWQSGLPKDMEEALGIKLGDSEAWVVDAKGQEVLELNILNPVATHRGMEFPMRVQVEETIQPTEWDLDNLEKSAKRRGAGGDFITHQGNYIFMHTRIVFQEPRDTYLEADAPTGVGVKAFTPEPGVINS